MEDAEIVEKQGFLPDEIDQNLMKRGEKMPNRPWFPTIHSDKCDGCKGLFKCVNFCPHGVLERKNGNVVVVNPLDCIDGCSACAEFCPEAAILFPSKAASSKSKAKPSLLHQVICRSCGKRFSTDRQIECCFDCEDRMRRKGQVKYS
ncbi:MAG: 4Fe-4S dicluster domain-containing protein [Candidatus Bathyarchaeota archaeon]|nr:MAG: 4Fe-4S dicluster domain-containing protein [Candidatus Bathyarchaeota archaeon]